MIETVSLFPKLNGLLISLLRSLTPEEWQQQTIAKKWKVKDVAAHLLDGNCRFISIYRDHYLPQPDQAIDSYESLVSYLNTINHEWVKAAKRLSPELITDMLESTGKEYDNIIAQLNPDDDAIFSVAWAGQSVSKNWFHIAREYTEKWHHQQQIRDAVNRPGIMSEEFVYPLMATFLQGLPHTFRNVEASAGTVININISEGGGSWHLTKTPAQWEIIAGLVSDAASSIVLPTDTAWKLFTKGLSPDAAEKTAIIKGDIALAQKVLELVAVMA
jgi:uncharacterized protein (TIGR03083 family)